MDKSTGASKEELVAIRNEMIYWYQEYNPHADHGHDTILLRNLLHSIDKRIRVFDPKIVLKYTLPPKDRKKRI